MAARPAPSSRSAPRQSPTPDELRAALDEHEVAVAFAALARLLAAGGAALAAGWRPPTAPASKRKRAARG